MYNSYLNSIVKNARGKDITILPHDCADVDAIISSILLSKLFDFFKISNCICIIDNNIGKDTIEILTKLGYDVNQFITNTESRERQLFLVDHYETKYQGNVIGIIDHHFTISNVKAKVYLYKESCATAYIIYKLMLEANMHITKEIVRLMAYAMLVDTSAFKSPKTIKSEKDELELLVTQYNLDYSIIKEDSLALTDINNMSIDAIVENGYKNYTFNKYLVSSSYVQIKGILPETLANNILKNISKKVKDKNIDMWVFIVFDMENDNTYVYYITDSGVKEQKYNTILSRGKNIIPKVEEYFNNI